jgi:delta-aminolevulinic acid dehydratase/porphobilinogen synthase
VFLHTVSKINKRKITIAMNQVEGEQLRMEIQHIFDSGANEIRIFEMIKSFLESRSGVNELSAQDFISRAAPQIHYDLSLKAMQLMTDKKELTVEEFRELPEVKKLWSAMDVIKEHYL